MDTNSIIRDTIDAWLQSKSLMLDIEIQGLIQLHLLREISDQLFRLNNIMEQTRDTLNSIEMEFRS